MLRNTCIKSWWCWSWIWGEATFNTRPRAMRAEYRTRSWESNNPWPISFTVSVKPFLKFLVQASAIMPRKVNPAYLYYQFSLLLVPWKIRALLQASIVFSPNKSASLSNASEATDAASFLPWISSSGVVAHACKSSANSTWVNIKNKAGKKWSFKAPYWSLKSLAFASTKVVMISRADERVPKSNDSVFITSLQT